MWDDIRVDIVVAVPAMGQCWSKDTDHHSPLRPPSQPGRCPCHPKLIISPHASCALSPSEGQVSVAILGCELILTAWPACRVETMCLLEVTPFLLGEPVQLDAYLV